MIFMRHPDKKFSEDLGQPKFVKYGVLRGHDRTIKFR